MRSYKPREDSRLILEQAFEKIQSVNYPVTARWVFYRLLQDGIYNAKSGYKHLLGILSKARKEFYGEWRPWTLADDTRAPILMQRRGYYSIYMRGGGFNDEREWLDTLKKEITCPLDRWANQPVYVELWFEAAAMQGQFLHYANENVPLLAFHGDVSIAEKWRCAQRLSTWWLKYKKPIHIFYYGDLDPKGEMIPNSAWADVQLWAYALIRNGDSKVDMESMRDLYFTRVGINDEHVDEFNLLENPEHPGAYQWEALDDLHAAALIDKANEFLDIDAFDKVERQEREIIKRFLKEP